MLLNDCNSYICVSNQASVQLLIQKKVSRSQFPISSFIKQRRVSSGGMRRHAAHAAAEPG
jgi:hypothetical protein